MNILLACNAGVSTGMLADKMEEYAKTQGINAHVWAVDIAQVSDELKSEKIDCALIGPQISYKLKGLQKELAPYSIPSGVMSFQDYGTMNAVNIFKTATKLMEDK